MTMNELKPLVSDEQIRGYKGEATIVKMLNNVELSPRKVRDIYEAERAKTHTLVQQLVDALEATKHKPDWWRHHPSEEWIYDVMADAKDAGFKPSHQ